MPNTNEDHLHAFWQAARIIRDGDQTETIMAYVIDLARTDFWPRLADRARDVLEYEGIAVIPTEADND